MKAFTKVMLVHQVTGAQILGNLAIGGFKGAVHTLIVEATSLTVLALPPDQIGAAMTKLAEANCFGAIIPGPADDLAAHVAAPGCACSARIPLGSLFPACS